jgi:tellurite resistance protein
VIGVPAPLVFVRAGRGHVAAAGQRHPEAWAEDRRHPVRHTFVAALPISHAAAGHGGRGAARAATPLVRDACGVGQLSQLWVTAVGAVALVARQRQAGGLCGPGVTPALFIPIVGNVLVPLAGVPLGHAWSLAQFGIGLLFWPVVLVLLMVRVAVARACGPTGCGPRLHPHRAAGGGGAVGCCSSGAPLAWAGRCGAWRCSRLAWVGCRPKAIAALPFGCRTGALSFPLAALAALTLRLAGPGSAAGRAGAGCCWRWPRW